MTNKISQKVEMWQRECPDGPSYNDLNAFIRFRAKESFENYNLVDGESPRFEKRLEDWLENLPDSVDQRKLFELVPKLYFFGDQEFQALYRAAYREIILNWLVDLYSIDITQDTSADFIRAIGETWFCAVTDSMNISAFCKINGIHGQPHKPIWRSLAEFGDMDRIRDYLANNGIKNIVLLEDFVGSGSQFLGKDEGPKKSPTILDCLLNLGRECNALILPLISCPEGVKNINEAIESVSCSWIQCKTTFLLTSACFVKNMLPDKVALSTMEQAEHNELLDLHSLVKKIGTQHRFKYGPFGYRGMGSLVVMYTNCSDNTLAIVYERLHDWSPLFRRIDRVS